MSTQLCDHFLSCISGGNDLTIICTSHLMRVCKYFNPMRSFNINNIGTCWSFFEDIISLEFINSFILITNDINEPVIRTIMETLLDKYHNDFEISCYFQPDDGEIEDKKISYCIIMQPCNKL